MVCLRLEDNLVTVIFIARQFHGTMRMGTCPSRGATTAEKLRGSKVWVPTPGRLRPAPCQRLGWVFGAEGDHPSRCEGSGYYPRKIFENSDANLAFW